MSILTKDQWAELEKKLSHPYGSANLLIDGYEVLLAVHMTKPLRMEIYCYINGHLKGEYIVNDCEERWRFMRPSVHNLYPRNRRKKMDRLSKKYALGPISYITYSWSWTSFTALRRHLVKNNQSIAIIEETKHGS